MQQNYLTIFFVGIFINQRIFSAKIHKNLAIYLLYGPKYIGVRPFLFVCVENVRKKIIRWFAKRFIKLNIWIVVKQSDL